MPAEPTSGIDLANAATAALGAGDSAEAARLATRAADAFLAEQGEPSFDAPNLLRVAAEAELAAGDHEAALRTLERGGQLAIRLPPSDLFDRLRVHLGRLHGQALLDGGDRFGARAVLLQTLKLCEEALSADDPDAALLHNTLGVVAKFTGDFDEAAARYARALAILDRPPGGPPEAIAGLHHNLAGLAHSRGDLPAAEEHARHALALHARAFGESHVRAAADRGELGSILSELGRHAEAERELRRTVADFADALGQDHVEVGIAKTSLGAALHRAGRPDEAERAYREGLAVRERARGSDHPELAPTLLNLSELVASRGDISAARELAGRVVAILEGRVQPDHPHLGLARAKLAALEREDA